MCTELVEHSGISIFSFTEGCSKFVLITIRVRRGKDTFRELLGIRVG